MNEQLQTALADLLSKANEGIDSASGFLVDEIPDVIYQLLMWYGVYSAIMCVAGIIYLSVLYKAIKWSLTGPRWDWHMKQTDAGFPTPVFYMLTVLLLIPVFHMFNLTWLKIWIAPKIWLIEYAATLAK